ncbi:hypothetical protein SteCoe_26036 [Stentor coeruleus]|uniref:CLN3 protein n=1 Tax=Stentor coeruleus TaxID=5963 RepID=A0A1R2BE79_9CILI|nr:hypothetical protein SteCoe_26036 [Stentor coeruleus]
MDSFLSLLEPPASTEIKKLSLILLYYIGLANNLGYSMVFTGAHSLVNHMNLQNSIGYVILSLVSCDFIILVLNIRFFIGIANRRRIFFCCFGMCISYGAISYSMWYGSKAFPIALVSFALIGMCASIGECVNLGMLKEFFPEYLKGFIFGTGTSRLVAASLWIIVNSFYKDDEIVWASTVALGILYYIAFTYIQKQVKQGSLGNPNVELTVFVVCPQQSDNVSSATGNAYFSMTQLKVIVSNTKFLALTLSSSYFLEAVITVGFADRISLNMKKYGNKNFFTTHNYELIQFFYYSGILIGKYFISIVKTGRLWILIILQICNFSIMAIETGIKFMPYWGNYITMFWVGILGGLCYANVFYLMLNSEDIPKYYKEACSNFILVCGNFSILLAALCTVMIDNYIITN